MSSYYLDSICKDCHLGFLEPHQDEKLQGENWVKCNICAFSCIQEPEVKNKYKIIYGRPE